MLRGKIYNIINTDAFRRGELLRIGSDENRFINELYFLLHGSLRIKIKENIEMIMCYSIDNKKLAGIILRSGYVI